MFGNDGEFCPPLRAVALVTSGTAKERIVWGYRLDGSAAILGPACRQQKRKDGWALEGRTLHAEQDNSASCTEHSSDHLATPRVSAGGAKS